MKGGQRLTRDIVVAASLLLTLTLSGGTEGALAQHQGARAAATPRHSSSAIGITSDGATLLVVNPDSNSVTLVDTATQTVLTELTVGIDPRSVAVTPDDSRAFVANQGSDTVSVIDLATEVVSGEIPVGDRPMGVAVSPDGRFLAVAELGDDRVHLINTADLSTLSATEVADRPHGLAFTPDSRQLLITHLLSGEVTILTVQSFHLYLPVVSQGQLVSRYTDTLATRTSSTVRLPYSAFRPPAANLQPPPSNLQPLTSNFQPPTSIPTWPNVAPAPSVIVNSTGTRAYLPQTMANGAGRNTGFDTTVFPRVSVLNLETQSHQFSEFISLSSVDTPVGLPWDSALTDDDSELWVVHAASNDLSVLDISGPGPATRVAHILVGDNPRGIVISPDGTSAYVNNTLAGTVSVIDTGTYSVTSVITVTTIPLPPTLLNGKRLYHSSARSDLAQARWISCNTCHVEGEHDGRTWLLQLFPGIAPPGAVITRNTTSLLGMIETYPLRWSAEWDESADSEFSIRFEQFGTGLIDGPMNPTLGDPNQGRSYDLDCLAAFIDSLAMPARTHALTAAEQRGQVVFESAETGCADCHPAPLYTDLQVHDVGTADAYGEWFGPLIDTPTLRFLYDSAPYLHDGSSATLYDVLTTANPADEHGVTSHLTQQQIADLVAFMLALPAED